MKSCTAGGIDWRADGVGDGDGDASGSGSGAFIGGQRGGSVEVAVEVDEVDEGGSGSGSRDDERLYVNANKDQRLLDVRAPTFAGGDDNDRKSLISLNVSISDTDVEREPFFRPAPDADAMRAALVRGIMVLTTTSVAVEDEWTCRVDARRTQLWACNRFHHDGHNNGEEKQC